MIKTIRLVSADIALLGRENAKKLANVWELSKRIVETALMSSKDPATAIAGFFMSEACLLYTSPSPRDRTRSRMPSSA